LLMGEIGGNAEERAAEYVKKHVTKPVAAFIAGQTAPPGKRMGHAGAVIAGGKGTAADKYRALDKSGARTVKSPADLGKAMAEELAKSRAKPQKKVAGPSVLIIEPKGSSKKPAPKKRASRKPAKAKAKAKNKKKTSAPRRGK